MFVDSNDNGVAHRIPVHLDISVMNIPCACKNWKIIQRRSFSVYVEFSRWFLVVGIDIQDDLGRHEVGFIDNTLKTPDNDGKGCRINASFSINRVPGNFHVSTHSAASQPQTGDMKHVIHDLTFGESIKVHLLNSFIFYHVKTKQIFRFQRVFDKFQIEKLFIRYVVLTTQIVRVTSLTIIWWKLFQQFTKIFHQNVVFLINTRSFIG